MCDHKIKLFLILTTLFGCSSNGDPPADGAADVGTLPPRICKTPLLLGEGPYFKDVTFEYGFHTEALALEGTALASADINNDGLPDLIVHKGDANIRDDMESDPPVRYKRLLLNLGPGHSPQFKDISDESNFFAIRGGGLGRSCQFAVFTDINNDGNLDAYSGTYTEANPDVPRKDPGDRSEIMIGDGNGKFTFAPQSDTTHEEMYTTDSASFLDYNLDGNIDIFVGFRYEMWKSFYGNQDRLYRGNGDGTFTEVTHEMGLTTKRDSGFETGENSRPTEGVTACDIDNDGDPDLMVAVYGRQWNMLWRNDGDKFVDIGRESGYAGDNVIDYSDDQFYHCYCYETGKCHAPTPLIMCDQYSWVPGISDQPWQLNGNTFTTVCGDYDNDGDLDLFNGEIRHWHIGKASDPSEFLVNPGATPLVFERPGNEALGLVYPHPTPYWNEGHLSAAFFDFDADGLKDLIIMDSDYPDTRTLLFRQKADHTFYEIAEEAGIAHDRGQHVTLADFDGDGDLDAIMGTSPARGGPQIPQVYAFENLVGNKSNWTKIKLIGAGPPKANRSAIGARVTIWTDAGQQVQEVTGGYGVYSLQHGLVLYFGLGNACTIDKIEIRWPDKDQSISTFTDVLANYEIQIEQQDNKLTYNY